MTLKLISGRTNLVETISGGHELWMYYLLNQ
nr:MAG TPA: hypothetical protein [Caudoviricetes sp.]